MKGKLSDEQRLTHILEAISEIESYKKGLDIFEFKKISLVRFATIKQLEIIGEAVKNISPETKSRFPQIEWKQISGLRNILIHEYFGVDADLIWQIVDVDIPHLKSQLISGRKSYKS